MTHLPPLWAASVAVVTAYWVAVAFGQGDLSPVATTAAGAAAAAATVAVAGAGWRPRTVEATQVGGLVIVVLPVAVAAAGGGSARLLGVVFAAGAAAALVVMLHDAVPASGRRSSMLQLGAGSLLVAAAIVMQRLDSARWALPGDDGRALVLALAGAGIVLAAVSAGSPRSWALAAPAVVVALAAAGHLSQPGGAATAAAVAALAALGARRPVLPLAILAVAAAGSPATAPAAGLFAAAAVLTLVLEHPGATALALPGAAAAAIAVVPAAPSTTAAVVAAGVLTSAAAFARRELAEARRPELAVPVESMPAMVLAGWLVVAPGTWAWAGDAGLEVYDRGAAVAAASAGLALLVPPLARTRRRFADGPADAGEPGGTVSRDAPGVGP